MSRLSASRTSRHRQVPPKAGQCLPGAVVIRVEKQIRNTAKTKVTPEKFATVLSWKIGTVWVPAIERFDHSVIRFQVGAYTSPDQKSMLAPAKRHTGGLLGAFSFLTFCMRPAGPLCTLSALTRGRIEWSVASCHSSRYPQSGFFWLACCHSGVAVGGPWRGLRAIPRVCPIRVCRGLQQARHVDHLLHRFCAACWQSSEVPANSI